MKRLFLLVFYVACASSYGQVNNVMSYTTSPNASGLGTYGVIDISPFNGLANINVDAFSLAEGDIPVKGSLNYYSGGIKPEAHPGWVGLNWSLSTGGVITRKVNGGVDEVANTNPTNNPVITDQYSYLYHYSDLAPTAWNTPTFVTNHWPNNRTTVVCNPAPDEFYFTLPNGVSGSFMLNHNGSWVVKTKNAVDLKVSPEINSAPVPLAPNNTNTGGVFIKRLFYKIVIKDQLGYTYTYGNDPNAIEYTRGPGNAQTYTNYEAVVANAWYLTKIESPKGYTVNYQYEHREYQYVQNKMYPSTTEDSWSVSYNTFWVGIFNSSTQVNNTPAKNSAQIISPCYLRKITASSFSIDFNIIETNELRYAYDLKAFGDGGGKFYFVYGDVEVQDQPAQKTLMDVISKWYKLDNIVINDYQGFTREKYAFGYNDVATERLMLKTFKKVDIVGGKDMVYTFAYNPGVLPPYNSLQNDQWGYFNGIQFPTTGYNSSYLVINPAVIQNGVLTSITYPTGGYTNFEYEPNSYASVIKKEVDPITFVCSVNLVSQAASAAGLRIKKITSLDNFGKQTSKEYKYLLSSDNLTSSGIIAGNRRLDGIAMAIGNPPFGYYFRLNFNDLQPLNYTNGRDIVYSEVKELLSDGSYTWYKYSNSNVAAYKDEPPLINSSDALNPLSGPAFSSYSTPYISHISRELERGNLLYKETRNSAGQILQTIQNTYNNDPARFNDANSVRSYDIYDMTSADNKFSERYFQPVKIYTYYPYLLKSIRKDYDETGANPVTSQFDYVYASPNSRQLRQVTATTSKNETDKTENIYANDVTNGTYTLAGLTAAQLADLQTIVSTNNITGAAVQVNKTYNTNGKRAVRTNYQIYNGKPLVSSFQTSSGSTSFEDQLTVNDYDAASNIVQTTDRSGLVKSYLWDYKNQYKVAEVTGTAPVNIAYTSFEGENTGSWKYYDVPVIVNSLAPTGKKVYELAPLTNRSITRGINNRITYILTLWASNTINVKVNGVSPAVTGRTVNGYRFCEWQVAGVTSVSITGTASVYIDELRLYPKGSLMSTYTYEPLVGLTSQTDVNNRSVYNEYDNLNRIIVERDLDKNITKKYCYNLKGQVEDCSPASPAVFYNTPQSGPFTRLTCPCGQQSSPVTFYIPANAFASQVNITDANNKAVQYMNDYGPAYANKYGVCAPIVCTGADKKIINCVCETGVYGQISAVRSGSNCIYKYGYIFSDGSSVVTLTQTIAGPCN